jgi:hypothetical protein
MRLAPLILRKYRRGGVGFRVPVAENKRCQPAVIARGEVAGVQRLQARGRQVVQLAHQVAVGDQRRAKARVARIRLAYIRVEHIAAILLGGRSTGGVAEHRRACRLLHLRQIDGRGEALQLLRVIRRRRRVADGAYPAL